jgi:hypothetical protein
MQATSIQSTDMKSDLAAILHAFILEASSRRFVVKDDQICLNDQAYKPSNIDSFLSATMIPNRSCLQDEMYVAISLINRLVQGCN